MHYLRLNDKNCPDFPSNYMGRFHGVSEGQYTKPGPIGILSCPTLHHTSDRKFKPEPQICVEFSRFL